jgi:hypothetical protein
MKLPFCNRVGRILLTLILFIFATGSDLQAQEIAIQRPNIIWFMTEDIGCQLGCFGEIT